MVEKEIKVENEKEIKQEPIVKTEAVDCILHHMSRDEIWEYLSNIHQNKVFTFIDNALVRCKNEEKVLKQHFLYRNFVHIFNEADRAGCRAIQFLDLCISPLVTKWYIKYYRDGVADFEVPMPEMRTLVRNRIIKVVNFYIGDVTRETVQIFLDQYALVDRMRVCHLNFCGVYYEKDAVNRLLDFLRPTAIYIKVPMVAENMLKAPIIIFEGILPAIDIFQFRGRSLGFQDQRPPMLIILQLLKIAPTRERPVVAFGLEHVVPADIQLLRNSAIEIIDDVEPCLGFDQSPMHLIYGYPSASYSWYCFIETDPKPRIYLYHYVYCKRLPLF